VEVPVGDRRTKDQLTEEQRAYNRLRAGLRALVEQTLGRSTLRHQAFTLLLPDESLHRM
jgi:hypothetical protein